MEAVDSNRFKHIFDFYGAERVDNSGLRIKHRPVMRSNSSPGYVYILESDGFIKIGIANDVQRRIKNLQCGNPHEIRLLNSVYSNDPSTVERVLHRRLDRYNIRLEWFKLPDRITRYLASIRSFDGIACK